MQKVRVGKSQTKKQHTYLSKNTLPFPAPLSQKTIEPISCSSQVNAFSVEPKKQCTISTPIVLKNKLQTQPNIALNNRTNPPDSFVRDRISKPIPTVKEVKFQAANFEQMLYLATAIVLGLLFLFFLTSGVLFVAQLISPAMFPFIGFFAEDVLLIISLIGVFLIIPTYHFFRKFIRITLRTPIVYGKNEYFLGDFKFMSRKARLKNIFHNLFGMALFGLPLIALSYIFPPLFAVVLTFAYILAPYYLLKFFAILLFSKHD